VRHDRKTPADRNFSVQPALLALLSLTALGAAGCSTWHAPELRQPATEPRNLPEPATADERVAECTRLRTELRRNQIAEQEAPTTTTSPIIAEASEAKADRNISIIQSRYTELDCDAPDAAAKPTTIPLP
jgi:outer membrane lipopolysaccharide assembly protein LptE/RlpB